jgi:hypothetical protein
VVGRIHPAIRGCIGPARWDRRAMRLLVVLVCAACATAPNGQRLIPPIVDLGAFVHDAPAQFTTPAELVTSSGDYAERTSVPRAPETARATGFASRFLLLFARHFVAGVETEVGSVSSTSTAFASTRSSIHLGFGVVAGVTGRLGRLSANAELAASLRKLERHTDDGAWFFYESHGSLESRLRADVWLLPWLTGGASFGVDRAGARTLTVGIGIHVIAYDLR